MAYKTKHFATLIPYIERLPDGTYFDTYNVEEPDLQFQAQTQEAVQHIRTALGLSVPWKKEWDKGLRWWEYVAKENGISFRIYAVRQAPPTCTAITETRTVKKRVPIEYREEEVTEEVIVGWDCGGDSA